MATSKSDKLRKFYRCFTGSDQVLILINADPDALSSAMAVKRLLWRKVSSVTISHINVIRRPDNLAMIRLLKIPITHLKEIDTGKFNRFAIVDSQPDHSEMFLEIQPDVVIDHHPHTGIKAPFVDIRPDYGATATMMTEYLRSARIKPAVKIATGLMYGIKTDTSNFERQTKMEDLKAFQFLFKHANQQLAHKIEQSDLRLDFLKYFRNAIDQARMNRGRIFVHSGKVINPDICVLLAEFFMRVNPVTWSIVSGFFESKLIIIFRNDGTRKDAGKLAKKSFGKIGGAGGHKSMARAEIPVDNLPVELDLCDNKIVQDWIIRRIEEKCETTGNFSNVSFTKDNLGLERDI